MDEDIEMALEAINLVIKETAETFTMVIETVESLEKRISALEYVQMVDPGIRGGRL